MHIQVLIFALYADIISAKEGWNMLGLMKEIRNRHEKYADVAEKFDVDTNTV